MLSRKRPASDTLLPLHPAKIPRTARRTFSGGRKSTRAEDTESIGARWIHIFREVWGLAGETFASIANGKNHTEETNFTLPTVPTSPLPLQSPSTPSPSYHSHLEEHTPIPIQFPKRRSPLGNHYQLTREPTESMLIEGPSRPSTVTVTASTASIPSTSTLPSSGIDLNEVLTSSERRYKRDTSPRKYQNRPHIYADVHKARVRATNKKDREEMEKELYNLRRHSGYGSDFRTFQSLLSYRARLEMLERKDEALRPSPSLTDLRSKPSLHSSSRDRRHSISYDENVNFLERALAKARQTLKAPKPPKPFIPSFEQMQLSTRAKDDEIEQRLRPKPKPFPASLPPADEEAVRAIMSKRGVVSKHAREQVTDQDLTRLRPNQWLNDEIINFYGSMLLSRAEDCKENPVANGDAPGQPVNAHYFSTFFWSKLKGEGYEKARLAKWTKKFDLFSKDIILIPVNHNNSHWTAAAINFRRKRIESYDSMGMDRTSVFKLLRMYLDAEHRNKRKQPFDFTGWEDHTLEDTPQQENGFDCGVFTCTFLEALSRGLEYFNFSQNDMAYLRKRMIWEIGHAKLRSD